MEEVSSKLATVVGLVVTFLEVLQDIASKAKRHKVKKERFI